MKYLILLLISFGSLFASPINSQRDYFDTFQITQSYEDRHYDNYQIVTFYTAGLYVVDFTLKWRGEANACADLYSETKKLGKRHYFNTKDQIVNRKVGHNTNFIQSRFCKWDPEIDYVTITFKKPRERVVERFYRPSKDYIEAVYTLYNRTLELGKHVQLKRNVHAFRFLNHQISQVNLFTTFISPYSTHMLNQYRVIIDIIDQQIDNRGKGLISQLAMSTDFKVSQLANDVITSRNKLADLIGYHEDLDQKTDYQFKCCVPVPGVAQCELGFDRIQLPVRPFWGKEETLNYCKHYGYFNFVTNKKSTL